MACSMVNFTFFDFKLQWRKTLRNLDVEWRIILKFILKRKNIKYLLNSSVSEEVHWRAAARKVINLKRVPQNAGNSLTSWVHGLGLAGKQKPLRTNVTPSFRRSLNDKIQEALCRLRVILSVLLEYRRSQPLDFRKCTHKLNNYGSTTPQINSF